MNSDNPEAIAVGDRTVLNKDKRGIVLALCIGDGCFHYTSRGNQCVALTMDHGVGQKDYLEWKANILSDAFKRPVRVRQGHKGKSVQLSIGMTRFRSWRKFIYPFGKKDIARILPFLTNVDFAMAVWLMDDGYVEPSITKGKLYSAAFRLFTCSETMETQAKIQAWLKEKFDADSHTRWQKTKKHGTYPFLKINCKDSLKIWERIRETVLQLDSMKYKFRHIETIYQSRILQPQATFVSISNDQKVEDIVEKVI